MGGVGKEVIIRLSQLNCKCNYQLQLSLAVNIVHMANFELNIDIVYMPRCLNVFVLECIIVT